MLEACVNSEFGKLNTVLLHEPGAEVENMTPQTAERALYSDILNLPIARREYTDFKGVLEKTASAYQIKDLLNEALKKRTFKKELAEALGSFSPASSGLISDLLEQSTNEDIISAIIEGIPLPQISLTNFLKNDKFAISPMHNLFFMRDASFTIGKNVYISSMARSIRKAEARMLQTLYKHTLMPENEVVFLNDKNSAEIKIEGGDVLVASSEVLIIGVGSRTSPEAIDTLIKKVSERQNLKYLLIQELPQKPESFIHLDMVFTLLSESECMVYKPVILDEQKYQSILIKVDNGVIKEIDYIRNLIDGLKICGMDYKPIFCGESDHMHQEREQWHSGANFFAIEPGKIIGYARNIHTTDALFKEGYEIISAHDIIAGNKSMDDYKKCVITIEGSELARGGGGARCMTMPLNRT